MHILSMKIKIIFLNILLIFSFSITQAVTLNQTLTQSCSNSLCGPDSAIVHPFDLSLELKKTTEQMVSTRLKKPIQNYMGRVINQTLLQDKIFKNLFEQKDHLAVTPEQQGLIQALLYFKKLSDFMPTLEKQTDGTYIFNQEKLKTILGNPTPDELNAASSLVNIVNDLLMINSYSNEPLEIWIKALHPDKSFTEAIQLEANLIQILSTELEKIAPTAFAIFPKNLVVSKTLSGQVLSSTDKKSLLTLSFRQKLISKLLQPDFQEKFRKIPLDIPAFLSGFQKTYLNSKVAKAIQTPTTIRAIFQNSVNTCMDRVAYSYGALPTKEATAEFLQKFFLLQTMTQQMIEEKTKTSLVSNLNIEVLLPEINENLLPGIETTLKNVISSEDKSIKYFKNLDFKNISDLNSFLVTAAAFSDTELLSEVTNFCDQTKAPTLNDAAASSLNMMILSWSTIQNPDVGVGIIAHELGHIVSARWPTFVTTEKTCLGSNSTNHIEEDFADLFSATLLKRANNIFENLPLKNFGCALLSRDSNGWTQGTLANPDATDTHSSDFYRLLAIGSITTGLTNQCTSYLSEAKSTIFDHYCQWQK